MKKIGFLFFLSLFWMIRAAAQENPHAGCAAPPVTIPDELLQRTVMLRSGVGNSREQITSESKSAAEFYNQGLNYLESFVWIEAARSFHQALRHDSNLAMAYLGLSYVSSGIERPPDARKFLEKAKSLSANLSDRELRRINIREKQLDAIEHLTDREKHAMYKKEIDDALARYVDDPQLWVLRGNAEETTAAGRGQRGGAATVAFYNQVLWLVPDHATAHHYLVHTYETIGQIDKALEHGAYYAKLSPSIPHAAHMWGHDLRRNGHVDDAIQQFLKTDSLERAYYKAEKMEPGFDWHHGHNLDLLAGSYQHKGQMKKAEKTLREGDELVVWDAYAAFRQRELPTFFLHRGKYKAALKFAQEMTRSAHPQARTVGYAISGQASIGLDQMEDAKKMLQQAAMELQQVPEVTPGIIPNRGMVEPWVTSLRAEILFRTTERKEGQALLKNVQQRLRAIPGPDAWTQTLFRLEAIAKTARDVGDWELAEFTAEQMMQHDSAFGGSRLAMALVLLHKGDAERAAKELQTARNFWRDADPDLPELQVITRQSAIAAGFTAENAEDAE
jgi:tetratricopeptide (TPR) repeat protein